jgi:hypothetical protein
MILIKMVDDRKGNKALSRSIIIILTAFCYILLPGSFHCFFFKPESTHFVYLDLKLKIGTKFSEKGIRKERKFYKILRLLIIEIYSN